MRSLMLFVIASIQVMTAPAQTIEEDIQDYKSIYEEYANFRFDESRSIGGVVFLDFRVSESVFGVKVSRVTESGEMIPYAARYATDNNNLTHDILFFCEGDFYAIGLNGESEIETEMHFSVTKDMVVDDGDYLFTMDLK